MNLLISYHVILVKLLIFVMAINLFLPFLLKNNLIKLVKWTRIGYFSFWGAWAMVIFAGLVVFVFTKQKLTADVILMITASAILPFLDGYRAIKLGKIWQKKESGLKFSTAIVLLELAIVVATTVYSIVSK